MAAGYSLLSEVMAVVKDMMRYLRKPHPIARREAFTPDAVLSILKLLGFAFLMLPLLGIFMGVIFAVTGVTLPEPSEEFTDMASSPNFIFLAAIMAPIVEEFLYRAWLGRGWGVFLVAPLLLVGLALGVLVGTEGLSSAMRSGLAIMIIGSFALYLSRYLKVRRDVVSLDKALIKVCPFAFWGSSLGFGLMHLANYEGGEMGLLLPLIILPQFVVGVILGYVRMRFGLLSAIVFHGAYNTALLTVFTMLGEASL